jgi:hypothetical protein
MLVQRWVTPEMAEISRRTMLRCAVLTSTCGMLNGFAPVHAPDQTERAGIDALAWEFIKQNQIAGLSVAFAHQGMPAYEAAYGHADISR